MTTMDNDDCVVRVRVHGLVTAKQFNGQLGTRTKRFPGPAGRYEVILDGSGGEVSGRRKVRRLKIKAKNLEVLGPAPTSF